MAVLIHPRGFFLTYISFEFKGTFTTSIPCTCRLFVGGHFSGTGKRKETK